MHHIRNITHVAVFSIFVLLLTSSSWAESWMKSFERLGKTGVAEDVIRTSDGNYVTAGWVANGTTTFVTDAWVLKTTPGGNVVWSRNFGGSRNEILYGMDETQDHKIVVCGYTETTSSPIRRFGWITKIDQDGTILWQKAFQPQSFYSMELYDVSTTSDGGFIAAGLLNEAQRSGVLIRLDSAGNVLWQMKYPMGNYSDSLQAVKETPDGGFIAAGNVNFGSNPSALLVKLDGTGAIQWQKAFVDNGGTGAANDVLVTPEGYLFAGAQHSTNWAVMMSIEGNVIWQNTYGNSVYPRFNLTSAAASANGTDFFLAGESNNGEIIRIDHLGNALSQSLYTAPDGSNYVRSIKEDTDGTLIVAAGESHLGDGTFRLWHLEANGSTSPECQYVTLNYLPTTNSTAPATDTQAAATIATLTVVTPAISTDSTPATALQDCPCSPMSLDPFGLPYAAVNQYYDQTFTLTGGVPPYAVSTTTQNLPDGLNIEWPRIFGTPTAFGSGSININWIDATGCRDNASRDIVVTCPVLQVTPDTLPGGYVGLHYSQTLITSGGTGPYSYYELFESSLPPGLSLNTQTGEISGTPTQSGSYPVWISINDAFGCYGAIHYTIDVNTVDCDSLALSEDFPPSATGGVPFVSSLSATGGMPPYQYVVTDGQLPPGLILNTDGTITGTPTAGGNFTFTVQVTDIVGCTKAHEYSLLVFCTFCDDFSQINPGWLFNKGEWSRSQDGFLSGSSNGIAYALAQFSPCLDCTIDTKVAVQNAGAKLSVIGWYKDPDNYIQLEFDQAKSKITLSQIVKGKALLSMSATQTITVGQFYGVKLSLLQGRLNASIDSVPVFDVWLNGPIAGVAGFKLGSSSSMLSDNIVVY